MVYVDGKDMENVLFVSNSAVIKMDDQQFHYEELQGSGTVYPMSSADSNKR